MIKNGLQKGMTLVEVLVAITIFTLGIAGFSALFMRSWQSNAFILEEAQATRQAERALNKVVKDLREIRQGDDGSFAIKSADAFDLVVFANVDSDDAIERVHYFLDKTNDIIRVGITNPSGTPTGYPAADDSVSDVSYYVVNNDSQPMFSYYDKSGHQLSVPINLADVALIKVVVWVNIKPVTAPENVRLESVIQIRNLGEAL